MEVLKLKFDATLDYQLEAVASVSDLFAELPLTSSEFSLASQSASTFALAELGVRNPMATDEGAFQASILANLRAVQERNGIAMSDTLDDMQFSVEMETGTGKTYVYLRTIFELNKRYGFTKFVVVVPNVAIREGALASIELLRDHLRGLYDNLPFDANVYDSKHLGRVRQYATANTIQLLVMNIQAFQKDVDEDADATKANIINRAQDRMSGRRPIEFIQATRPVVIIDEPQNMESDAASASIARLNPSCTLRYSATHKRVYDRVYRLGPVEAYDLNLVKRIEVASVVADDNPNAAFVRLLAVDAAKARAQLTINHGQGSAFKTKKVWVKCGDDLAVASADRQEYAEGWIVSDISFRAGAEAVEFTNGAEITMTEASAAFDEDIQRAQVVETVRQHLDKERTLAPMGVKVLSLFFLDRVANYRDFDDDGQPKLGKIGEWFEQAYVELAAKPRYNGLNLPPVEQVHDGYFSVDNKQRAKDTRGDSAADINTYDLIMRDKERLRITNAKKRHAVRFRKQVMLGTDFKDLWERISKRTKYRVSLSTDELVGIAADAIAKADPIEPPKVRVQVVELEQSAAGIAADRHVDQHAYDTAAPLLLPDILADLQNETDLTRTTLVRVLRESGRVADFTINPQAFTVLATSRINAALHKQMVDGIRYEPVPGLHWEMHRLEPEASEEIERYAARLYSVQNESKTLYDHIEIDSEVERRFAKGLDDNQRVRFFMKLPAWFVVDTPIGPYNPDWAIVFGDSERVYLVRETKGSVDPEEIRGREGTKIRCARQHFAAIDVDYAVTASVEDMVGKLSSL